MSPTKLPKLLGAILGLLCCFSLPAEPLNVLVGDLTFTRPNVWKWEPPDPRSPAVTSFVIPNEGGKHVEVRFYGAGPEPEAAAKMWKAYAVSDEANNIRQETKTIGSRTITYIFLKGTLKLPAEKPADHQGFVGIVIPSNGKFVHIRCAGPNTVIQNALSELKTMVEEAVKEREAELSNE